MDIIEEVTNELTRLGVTAEVEHTGGGCFCIRIERGAEYWWWGVANDTWGADHYADLDGETLLDDLACISIPCSTEAPASEAALAIARFYA